MNLRNNVRATSLVLLCTSTFAAIPAEAATYKRIQDNEGKIYDGTAYGYGCFYIDGQVNELEEGVYYLSNDKYIKLKESNSGDEVSIYGEKYLELQNGDSYLDLGTGKVIEDDLKNEEKDDASLWLKKKIRKDNDGRYLENVDIDYENMNRIENSKFSDSWYYTFLEGNESQEFLVFTDKKGNYIDADYNIGKVPLYAKNLIKDDKRVTLENTIDKKEGLCANIYNEKILGQDKDNIYRLAYLEIIYDDGQEIKNVTTGDSITFGGSKNNNKFETVNIKRNVNNHQEELSVIPVIQKISKEQAKDTVDGAKYPKNVETYFLTGDEGGELEVEKLLGHYSISDGKIISYGFEDDKLKAYSISLKSKNGYNYTDFSYGTDIDSDDVKDIDVSHDGELYILESGFIKKFNNDDEFEKIYKVDGSMSEFSVYDNENILVWDEDDEVYSIITKQILNKSTEVNEEKKAIDAWVENEDKTWSYLKPDGSRMTGWVQSISSKLWYYMNNGGIMASNCWIKDNDKWYHFNENGAMQTGWNYIDNNWYYLNKSGDMKTGWMNDRGTWYYLNESGTMVHDSFIDGYYLGENGAWTR